MVTTCRNKDEKMRFFFDRDKLHSIYPGVMYKIPNTCIPFFHDI